MGFERLEQRLLQVTSDSALSRTDAARDRQYCAVFPETMCELVNDSDDEGTGRPLLCLSSMSLCGAVQQCVMHTFLSYCQSHTFETFCQK